MQRSSNLLNRFLETSPVVPASVVMRNGDGASVDPLSNVHRDVPCDNLALTW